MKQTMQISALIIFALLIIFPRAASSEVKITLKNGREIIADRCMDSEGKLTCYKNDGTFRIDRKEILEMKNIIIERRLPVEEPAPADSSPEQKKDEPMDAGTGKADEKAGAKPPELKTGEKQSEGGPIKGLKPEEREKLDRINKKKIEYQAERQRLITERDQLHEDVKNTGMIKTQEQFDAIKKRITDLEVRINSFNEDVRKLNDEERKILGSSTNTQ